MAQQIQGPQKEQVSLLSDVCLCTLFHNLTNIAAGVFSFELLPHVKNDEFSTIICTPQQPGFRTGWNDAVHSIELHIQGNPNDSKRLSIEIVYGENNDSGSIDYISLPDQHKNFDKWIFEHLIQFLGL